MNFLNSMQHMISQLKKALTKARRNPRYLWYFWQNVDIMRDHDKVIGMTPHFHPDRVRRQDVGRLAAIDGRLFCRVFSTCCTFFMPVRHMRRFEKYLRLYDGWEKGSVGVAWSKGVCFSPLGWTMAEHLHRSDLSPVCDFNGRA